MFILSSFWQIASTDQPPSYPKSVSPSVKQFLDSCFNRVPEQRPTAHRLLQHPVFSAIVSAPEPSTKASSASRTTNSSLSKSFTAVSLSSNSSSSRATSRHRALPPVPHESSLPPTTLSPLTNYDKLVSPVPTPRQQQHQVVPQQRKICRNQWFKTEDRYFKVCGSLLPVFFCFVFTSFSSSHLEFLLRRTAFHFVWHSLRFVTLMQFCIPLIFLCVVLCVWFLLINTYIHKNINFRILS